MAFLEFKNVRIAGISAGVPKNVEKTISTTGKYASEDFVETTGIRERRYSDDYTTSDYCQAAAEQLLNDLEWDKKDIDAMIFVSQTPDYLLPATSCVLQGKLGFKKECYCLDINLGCTGWVYGLSTMMSLMQQGTIKKALLLAGDARKQAYEEPDQLFGWAGTVTALEYNEELKNTYKFYFGTDGTGYEAIIRPVGGTRNQITADALIPKMCEDGRMRHGFQTRMNGMDVFAFGITTAPKSIKKLGEHFGFDYNDYEYFVFHQANFKMNETIRKKLKLTEEQVPYSIHEFGNTSSASIPLTIITQIKDKVTSKPTKIIGCGFGVGLSWGTVAFETDGIVISNLVEL